MVVECIPVTVAKVKGKAKICVTNYLWETGAQLCNAVTGRLPFKKYRNISCPPKHPLGYFRIDEQWHGRSTSCHAGVARAHLGDTWGCSPCSPGVLLYFIFISCFTAEPPQTHVADQERGSQPFCPLQGETPDRYKPSPSCPFFWPFPSLQIIVWPVLMCHLPDTLSLLLSDGLDSYCLALVLTACSYPQTLSPTRLK